MIKAKSIIVALTAAAGLTAGAWAAGSSVELKQKDWTFDGPFGTFDRPAAQRGFQVYREVCSSCHSLKYFKFRNLADLGYNDDMIKAFAAEYEVVDAEPDENGDEKIRKGEPKDGIPAPFANENAARASNNGAYPPDLSLMTKARADGANYLYSLLTGYIDAPSGTKIAEGMSYNAYFPGHQIAMGAPLMDDGVEYGDGTAATLDQMSYDVTNFLHYVAEPKLEARHKMGAAVMIFLIFMTILTWLANKRIWTPVKEGKTLWEHGDD